MSPAPGTVLWYSNAAWQAPPLYRPAAAMYREWKQQGKK